MAEPFSTFATRRVVEFADTDMAGIVHFARFFIFMETAEHRLIEALGSSVHTEIDGVRIGWPRVSARCEYLRPVRFRDVLDIHLRVARKGRSSMTYAVEFRRQGELVARGESTSVCCDLDAPGGPRPIPIPAVIAARLVEATGDLAAAAGERGG